MFNVANYAFHSTKFILVVSFVLLSYSKINSQKEQTIKIYTFL